jgi:rhodanese-related sulfurtransferase
VSWASKYEKDQSLVLYCARTGGGTSARVVQILSDLSYGKVHVLEEGWHAWVDAGYPDEPKGQS